MDIDLVQLSAATATDTEVAAAPGAGLALDIHGVYFSTDTATTVTLEHGSTTIWEMYVATDGGFFALDRDQKLFESLPENTALTYTTDTTATTTLIVWSRGARVG